MEPRVIRSRRRTFGLELKNGELLARVPRWATDEQAAQFIAAHRRWIERALAREEARQREAGTLVPFTEEELAGLTARAKEVIPQRVALYAPLVGVSCGRITIRRQRSRWGSCSAKGDLSFNCLLMLAPDEVLDSVVVHELCHRRQMDHSRRFYAEVLRVFPRYRECQRWLKEHGGSLTARLPDKKHIYGSEESK